MAESTAIEWCDSTFNPWIGCTPVSLACDDCYAARSTPARTLGVAWGSGQPRHRTSEGYWELPERWQRQAAAFQAQHGRRRRVFCASLADVFDNAVPTEWRVDLFRLIAATPGLDWLLLTKRIGNAWPMMLEVAKLCGGGEQPMPNVWLGATVVNQAEVDRDVPKLLATPAARRFLSIEPMLGVINLHDRDDGGTLWIGGQRGCGGTHRHRGDPAGHNHGGGSAWVVGDPMREHHHHDNRCGRGIDWAICGGESGSKARPMRPDWARSLRDQCAAAGVPFLFKQWGEHTPGELQPHPAYPDDARSAWRLDQRGQRWHDVMEGLKPISTWEPVKFIRVGKTVAGRLLDGRTHDEFPA